MSLTYPDDRTYHAEHLWAKDEADGTMLIGITDFAQDQLGGVIFVDLPAVGDHFAQGTSCASIESVKVTSDAIIPVSGEIVAVNEALADAPELLNDSPYDKGSARARQAGQCRRGRAHLRRRLRGAGWLILSRGGVPRGLPVRKRAFSASFPRAGKALCVGEKVAYIASGKFPRMREGPQGRKRCLWIR